MSTVTVDVRTAPSATVPATGVDLGFVRVLHDTFRRDFRTVASALAATRNHDGPDPQRVARFYDHLLEQLHHHHTIEDSDLIPVLSPKVTDPEMARALATVTSQHDELDAILERVELGMREVRLGNAASEKLLGAVDDLIAHLDEHLDDEERDAFPVVEKLMTAQEFEDFEKAVQKKMGLRGAAVTFPWILENADEPTRQTVLGQLPLPLRLLCRYVWVPAYRRTYALPA
jgi:hemerythrin-like domain-containing protein